MDRLYVVTRGRPGPEPTDATFVELETEDHRSKGVSSGAFWDQHPQVTPEAIANGAPRLYRLGPFAPWSEVERLREQVLTLATELVRLDARDPVELNQHGLTRYDERDNEEAWPSSEVLAVALPIVEAARREVQGR